MAVTEIITRGLLSSPTYIITGGLDPGIPVPTLTSITPNTGVQGTVVPIAFVGTGFDQDNLTVHVSGADVTPGSPTSITATTFSCDFTIGAGAAAVPRNVTVSTDAGTTGAKTFFVTSSTPGSGDPAGGGFTAGMIHYLGFTNMMDASMGFN